MAGWGSLPSAVFGLLGVLQSPLGRALADRLHGSSPAEPDTMSDTRQDAEGLQRRVLELEEPLDFAERLLGSGARGSGRARVSDASLSDMNPVPAGAGRMAPEPWSAGRTRTLAIAAPGMRRFPRVAGT